MVKLSKLLIGSMLFIAITTVMIITSCSRLIVEHSITHQIQDVIVKSGVTATFLGVSSILLDDGKTAVMIDGFLTRPKSKYFRAISPNHAEIDRQMNILMHDRRGHCLYKPEATPEQCRSPESIRGLAAVVPLHAHYDHGLDASLVAAWGSSFLVANASIRRIRDASKKLVGETNNDFNWNDNLVIKMDNKVERQDKSNTLHPCQENKCQFGDFKVTLVKTPHYDGLLTMFGTGPIDEDFSFPARIWDMNEGVVYSALIEHSGKRMLIVPSAGDLSNRLKGLKADVVMLGILGLGIKNKDYRNRFWDSTVTTTQPDRVILIHWDDDTSLLPEHIGESLKPAFAPLDITYKHFLKKAKKANIEIKFLPPLKPVDPFK